MKGYSYNYTLCREIKHPNAAVHCLRQTYKQTQTTLDSSAVLYAGDLTVLKTCKAKFGSLNGLQNVKRGELFNQQHVVYFKFIVCTAYNCVNQIIPSHRNTGQK